METITDTKEEMKTPAKGLLIDYELLSHLFLYPKNESDFKKIKDIHTYLSDTLPEAAEAMKLFMEFADSSTLEEMQELFLRSFDIQAITTLDIGFILFGEDYKRGQLLVHLNVEHREAGNVCHTELADHLPYVLCMLPKMKDETLRNEIATRLLLPAIVKMILEFDLKKIEKKDKVYKKHLKTIIDYSQVYRTAYQTLLQALFIALKEDFGYEPEPVDTSAVNEMKDTVGHNCGEGSFSCSHNSAQQDYSQNIETEMDIEKL